MSPELSLTNLGNIVMSLSYQSRVSICLLCKMFSYTNCVSNQHDLDLGIHCAEYLILRHLMMMSLYTCHDQRGEALAFGGASRL